MAEFGVQSPQRMFGVIIDFRGLWTSNSRSEGFHARVGWLKSKRPVNSLPDLALSWPLELQRGHYDPFAMGARCYL